MMNREQWLTNAIGELRTHFTNTANVEVPDNIRAACAWPSKSALSVKRRRVGEAWNPENSADGTAEIMISMTLDDPVEVLAVLAHELVHVTVGIDCGHRGPFKQVATKIGLEGKMTATVAGAELKKKLVEMADHLGPYPHAKLDGYNRPKQSTRLIKAQCEKCGYIIRLTAKWINYADPHCPDPHCEGRDELMTIS